MHPDGTPTPDTPLHLEPIDGPELSALTLREASNILGRGGKSSHVLPHDAVSREHLSITRHADVWYATDLASRNGTRLGNLPLPVGEPTPLQEGDTLEVKPWTFLVRLGEPLSRTAKTIADETPTGTRLRTSEVKGTEPRIRQQFESLLKASALLHSAKDEAQLLDYLLETTLGATGFERAAVIRRMESFDSVEVVSQKFSPEKVRAKPEGFHFSRSLLRAAANGPHAVVSEPGAITPRPDTMVRLDIAAAACAPIRLNEAIWGYLYLDSGAGTAPTATGELLEVVRTLTDIASLALSNVKQAEVRKRLATLQSDFEAAAEIRDLLLPPPKGRAARLEYAVRSQPGRIVSGDIFDVIDLGEQRVAVMLGDVMGKGLAAGLMMSSVQSFVQATVPECQDPAEILERLNRYVTRRVGIGRIVSLWLGIFDTERGVATVSDAGHGYCILIDADGEPSHLHCAGGTPLGANDESSYLTTTLALQPGQRLVIFSDGVVEQPSPSGERFGMTRLIDVLRWRGNHGPEALVNRILDEVREHTATGVQADDLTAAALMIP